MCLQLWIILKPQLHLNLASPFGLLHVSAMQQPYMWIMCIYLRKTSLTMLIWGQLVLDPLRPSVVVHISGSAIMSYYVLVRIVLIQFGCMGQVISQPNLAHLGPHARSIEIVYYVLVLGQRNKKTLDESYEEWDTTKSFRWTRFKEYAPSHQSLDYVVAPWARQNNASDDNVVIPARQILFAKDNLDQCTKGEHLTGGYHFEDGIPIEGL